MMTQKFGQPFKFAVRRMLLPLSVLTLVASCNAPKYQYLQDTTTPSSAGTDRAESGFRMAEALCSGCHAIAPDEISPNPESPTFMQIANTPNLDQDTLRTWLTDIHNYPEKMSFEIAEDDVDILAAYIITLRQEGYEPPSQ
ncbi:hypothetical protein [Pontixanthobacter aquaemixtae]|uniref:Cytochrome c domain-containing protein n=1 Tax=Pontixanthobacter aquaemixtae TaxID=1958940 RepID=A0A844ZQK4_9SPHN|nr:hypothetical protein [Pontixanthobacter aquaemixtae]MXO90135.1 hypothetical protein [Pontixanthobacter aquaemixtae]